MYGYKVEQLNKRKSKHPNETYPNIQMRPCCIGNERQKLTPHSHHYLGTEGREKLFRAASCFIKLIKSQSSVQNDDVNAPLSYNTHSNSYMLCSIFELLCLVRWDHTIQAFAYCLWSKLAFIIHQIKLHECCCIWLLHYIFVAWIVSRVLINIMYIKHGF